MPARAATRARVSQLGFTRPVALPAVADLRPLHEERVNATWRIPEKARERLAVVAVGAKVAGVEQRAGRRGRRWRGGGTAPLPRAPPPASARDGPHRGCPPASARAPSGPLEVNVLAKEAREQVPDIDDRA